MALAATVPSVLPEKDQKKPNVSFGSAVLVFASDQACLQAASAKVSRLATTFSSAPEKRRSTRTTVSGLLDEWGFRDWRPSAADNAFASSSRMPVECRVGIEFLDTAGGSWPTSEYGP